MIIELPKEHEFILISLAKRKDPNLKIWRSSFSKVLIVCYICNKEIIINYLDNVSDYDNMCNSTNRHGLSHIRKCNLLPFV